MCNCELQPRTLDSRTIRRIRDLRGNDLCGGWKCVVPWPPTHSGSQLSLGRLGSRWDNGDHAWQVPTTGMVRSRSGRLEMCGALAAYPLWFPAFAGKTGGSMGQRGSYVAGPHDRDGA